MTLRTKTIITNHMFMDGKQDSMKTLKCVGFVNLNMSIVHIDWTENVNENAILLCCPNERFNDNHMALLLREWTEWTDPIEWIGWIEWIEWKESIEWTDMKTRGEMIGVMYGKCGMFVTLGKCEMPET